jgi:hypothetical protein
MIKDDHCVAHPVRRMLEQIDQWIFSRLKWVNHVLFAMAI